MSHEIVTSRKRRLCIWSNATCAMPLCEALSFRRVKEHITRMCSDIFSL